MSTHLLLRSLALVMGVASAILSLVSDLNSSVGFMLGLGVVCLAIDALHES